LLDLFCGAGGAAMGYHRAGFEVVGVDINPQPNYPFEFWDGDAMDILRTQEDDLPGLWKYFGHFDAIHASPPCQHYSYMSACRPGLADKYPALIEPIRKLMVDSGLPYVIENVPGAPLINPITLCGFMFGHELYRHRLFESNIALTQLEHPKHIVPASKAGHWRQGTVMSVAGHFSPINHARQIMDIDWMTRDEMAEAIPPYYTQFIGSELMMALKAAA
jgi:DNA (cytosine-5)-methyltransferase 1